MDRENYNGCLDINRSDPFIEGAASAHSIDGMLLAELWHLPTINGYSSFQPPGYSLYFPDSQDYSERIRRHVAQYQVTGLCGLDMMTNRWSAWSGK